MPRSCDECSIENGADRVDNGADGGNGSNTEQRRNGGHGAIPLVYKGIHLDQHYRVDLIVEDTVVVEVKSIAAAMPVLVINFNVPRLMDGVRRLLLKDRLGERPGGSKSPRSHERNGVKAE